MVFIFLAYFTLYNGLVSVFKAVLEHGSFSSKFSHILV